MANTGNAHEASASAVGYLFQCRYALYAGLRAIPNDPQLEISIEKFDDVGFEAQGEPTQLIQTKHHIAKQGNLSDASADLWKTLLIWSSRVAKDIDAPFRTRFILLTTGAAPDDSAASLLRMRDRDEVAADKRLLKVVATSKSKEKLVPTSPTRRFPRSFGLAYCAPSMCSTRLRTSSTCAMRSLESFITRRLVTKSTTSSNGSKAGGLASS